MLWDVAKPNPVLTLEDLARLKLGASAQTASWKGEQLGYPKSFGFKGGLRRCHDLWKDMVVASPWFPCAGC